ncbi:MAG: histidine kinase [Spirochaetes bacterium GWB1_59_5]|nr:MAG: histidine kinase [Spirochaetes bacterium GWB1_59_5]
MKILVVDDSAVMRRIHRNILKERGIDDGDILDAADGQAALEIASRNAIGLFLVDWNMPRLNGLDFVQRIRAIASYAKTPIIMITSEAARYNVVEAIQAGVTNYVVKPIKGEALLDKIGRYLNA